MLKMRLQRVGRRNSPSYRVVVTDSRTGPKSNKHVDLLGSYSPQADRVQIDGERAKEWIAKGVQLSDTVHNILVGEKIIEGKKVNVLPKKSPIVSEKAEEETKAPAEESAPDSEVAEETPAESAPEEKKEEPVEETKEEELAEEVKEEAQAEEKPAEEATTEPTTQSEESDSEADKEEKKD